MLDFNTLDLPTLFQELAHDGQIRRLYELAFAEDLGPTGIDGDVTAKAFVPATARAVADVVFRQVGVLAGLATAPIILDVFRADVDIHTLVNDGMPVSPGVSVARLSGSLRHILAVERTLLNTIGRLSGIATGTRLCVDAVAMSAIADLEHPPNPLPKSVTHPRTIVLDTRKTVPGHRALEKYAVRCGGGHMHRMGLYDAVLIKDNHIAGLRADLAAIGAPFDLTSAVKQAVRKARDAADTHGLRFIELEVDSLTDLEAILAAGGCGVQIVLLDNMTPAQLAQAVALRDTSRLPVKLEASGGITPDRIAEFARSGVDRISLGSLTHGAKSLDVGLDIA